MNKSVKQTVAVYLSNEGRTTAQISERLAVSPRTVARWLQDSDGITKRDKLRLMGRVLLDAINNKVMHNE